MDVREKLVELPIEDALLVLREEHRQRTDSYTTFEFALLEIKTKQKYGLFECIEETAIETAIESIEKQIPKQINEDNICPCCNSYNETIKKRKNTVKNDVCYCWHCGQALKF